MKRLVTLAIVMVAFLFATCFPAATQDEAKALVKKAVEYFKANGKDKAFAAFMDPKGEFVKGELYIFVIDFQGQVFAHGMNPKLVGKNFLDLKDVDGKLYQREFVKVGKAGNGWVDYKYMNPETKKVSGKTSYVEGQGGFVFGCGVYK